jgi:Cdc6-like AAA superfamily ATPase
MSTVQELYCLKQGRNNFEIDAELDSDFYVPRSGLDIETITKNVQNDLITDRCPKRFVNGPYGVGKTHTLFTVTTALKRALANTPFGVEVTYISAPDFPKNARFLDLYSHILNTIGKPKILTLFQKLYQDFMREKIGWKKDELAIAIHKKLDEVNFDLATIISINSADENLIWRWLVGSTSSGMELTNLHVSSHLNEADPQMLVRILETIGKLFELYEKKKLVLLLDECERWEDLSDAALGSLNLGFLRLADKKNKHVSVIWSISTEAGGWEAETTVLEKAVVDRIQPRNVIEIPTLDIADAKKFMKDVVQYVRDPCCDVDSKIKADPPSETVDATTYPFSDEALEQILAGVPEESQLTPRRLIEALTNAVGNAALDGSKYVYSSYVE